MAGLLLPEVAVVLSWLEEEFGFFREALAPASNANLGASWLLNAAKKAGGREQALT